MKNSLLTFFLWEYKHKKKTFSWRSTKRDFRGQKWCWFLCWRHSPYVIYLAVCTIRTYLALSLNVFPLPFLSLHPKKRAFVMTNIAPSLFLTLSTFYPKNFLWQQLADDDNRHNIFLLFLFVVFNKTLLSNDISLPSVRLRRDESRKAFDEKSFQPYTSKSLKIEFSFMTSWIILTVFLFPLAKSLFQHFVLDFYTSHKAQLLLGAFASQLKLIKCHTSCFTQKFRITKKLLSIYKNSSHYGKGEEIYYHITKKKHAIVELKV